MRLSIEPFTHAIAHRVIRCCAGLLAYSDLTQFTYNAAFEVSSLVGVQATRHSIVDSKVIEEDFSCYLSRHVPGGNSLRISSEMICDHQHMLIASFGLFQREEVEAHQLQWTGADDIHKICPTVRWSHSLKATGAFLDPLLNIFGYPRPIESVSYQRKLRSQPVCSTLSCNCLKTSGICFCGSTNCSQGSPLIDVSLYSFPLFIFS